MATSEELMSKEHVSTQMGRIAGGRLDRFMLIPLMEEDTTWIDAGPVRIGVEGRAMGTPDAGIMNRGPSVHVFDAETGEEWLRFDCFDERPHYHYILQQDQHNVVWGFDPATNGELYPWVISMLRNRLAVMLRSAGASSLADAMEAEALPESTLDEVASAMQSAYQRTFPGTDMIERTIAWAKRWKELHPQFNTFGDNSPGPGL